MQMNICQHVAAPEDEYVIYGARHFLRFSNIRKRRQTKTEESKIQRKANQEQRKWKWKWLVTWTLTRKLTNKQWKTTNVRRLGAGAAGTVAKIRSKFGARRRRPPCRMAHSAKRRKKEEFAQHAGNSSQQFTKMTGQSGITSAPESCDRAGCPIADSSTTGRPARTG